MPERSRRAFLAATATALSLAGCTSRAPDAGSPDTRSQTDSTTASEPTGRNTAGESPTDAPTDTSTELPTETPLSDPPTIDAVDGSWPTGAFDAGGTRYDPDGRVPEVTPRVAWTAEHGFDYGEIVVADGTVVVVDKASATAYDATDGRRRWHREFEVEYVTGPTIGDGALYVAAGESVRALSLSDGTAQWDVETTGTVNDVVLADGELYVSTERDGVETEGSLIALDPSGTQQWRRLPSDVSGAYGSTFGEVAVDDTGVYAVTQGDGSATSHTAFERTDGTVRWSSDGLNHSGSLTVADGIVYAGGFYGAVRAQSTTDGTEQWEFTLDLPANDIAVAGDTVFAIEYDDEGDNLYALTNGATRWTAPEGGGILAAGDGLLVTNEEGFTAYDLDGTKRFETTLDWDPVGLALADGIVFAAGKAGIVRALAV